MLPARHRLTRGEHFSLALRHGVRAGRPTVVVHLAAPRPVDGVATDTATDTASDTATGTAPGPHPLDVLTPSDLPRVGLVVSRAVGGSVVRHRVQRRLRHLLRALLPDLPGGSLVVVRALPAAAERTSAELDADLRPALAACLRKLDRRGRPVPSGTVGR